MAVGDTDARIAAVQAALATADDATVAFIQALQDDAVKVVGDQPIMVQDDKAATRSRAPLCRCPRTPRT